MRFALCNDKLVEACVGLKAVCPGCSQPVIAKCGTKRIHHWAHKGERSCDRWWEPETPWHREWKNNFPLEWQEVFLPDERTGEKHIADIRTSHGLVIEFQHSHIDSQEVASREAFYPNMVWVVDGTRRKADHRRFMQRKDRFQALYDGILKIDLEEDPFPNSWLGSSVPVIFDFGTATLYCLFPEYIGRYAFLAEFSRKAFINSAIDGQWSLHVDGFLNKLRLARQEWEDQILKQKKLEKDRRTAAFLSRYRRRRRL